MDLTTDRKLLEELLNPLTLEDAPAACAWYAGSHKHGSDGTCYGGRELPAQGKTDNRNRTPDIIERLRRHITEYHKGKNLHSQVEKEASCQPTAFTSG